MAGDDIMGVFVLGGVVFLGLAYLKANPDILKGGGGLSLNLGGGAPAAAIKPTAGGGLTSTGAISTGTGTKDVFGVTKLYPDASPVKFSRTTGGGGIEHQHMASTGKAVDRREWEIRGPAFLNQEVTVYFNYMIKGADTMSIKLRGGPHSGDACACNYIHYVPVGGDTHYFGAQCPHLNYVKGGKPLFTLPNVANKWVGAKAVEWNEGSGVHCQTWIDLTGTPPGKWQKWIDLVDTGQFGTKPMTKSPWSCPTAEILMRTDFEGGGDSQAKFISAREIVPPTGGGGGMKNAAYAGYPAYSDYYGNDNDDYYYDDGIGTVEPDYEMIYKEANLIRITPDSPRITVV